MESEPCDIQNFSAHLAPVLSASGLAEADRGMEALLDEMEATRTSATGRHRLAEWLDKDLADPRQPPLRRAVVQFLRGALLHAEGHAKRAIDILNLGLSALEPPPEGEPPWRVRRVQIEMDLRIGQACYELHQNGELESAIRRLEITVQAIGLKRLVGRLWYLRALLSRRRCRYEECETHLRQAHQILRESGDRVRPAGIEILLGSVALARGDLLEAQRHFDQAEAVLVSERRGAALHRAYAQMGRAYLKLGHLDSARDRFGRSLEASRRLGDRHQEAVSLKYLGDWAVSQGQPEDALANYSKSEGLFHELENDVGEAHARLGMAEGERRLGRAREAMDLCAKARAVFVERECVSAAIWCAVQEGRNQGSLENYGAARERYEEAFRQFEERGLLGPLTDVLLEYGSMLAERGWVAEAAPILQRCLTITDGLKIPRFLDRIRGVLDHVPSAQWLACVMQLREQQGQMTALSEERAKAFARGQRMVAELMHDMGKKYDLIAYAVEEALKTPGDLEIPVSRGCLQGISAACGHGRRMCDDLLDVFRLESSDASSSLAIEEVDLGALVKEVVEEFRHSPDEGRTIDTSAAPDLPPVRLDRRLTARILRNLVGNALQHAKSSRIEVAVVRESHGPAAVLQVRDWGEGIPPELQGRLFNAFVRGECRDAGIRAGHGIGLAFCKRAVEAQGGEIRVESQVGKGSTFSCRFLIQ